jgi:hypothetical protein
MQLNWQKSSFSGGGASNCVEVGADGDQILLRDSKDPNGTVLSFTPDEWDAFVKGAAAGEFRF